jgi:(4S)-4-hydroxy-5-phosphonooxypentane-2,3-dione isomerase
MIVLMVTYVAQEGREAELAARLREMTGHTRQEPGCRVYIAHQSQQDPRKFVLYEQYDDEAALDAHRTSDYFKRIVQGEYTTLLESRSPEFFAIVE